MIENIFFLLLNRFDLLPLHSAVSFGGYCVTSSLFLSEDDISIETIIVRKLMVRDLEKDPFKQREGLGKHLANSRNQRTVCLKSNK